MKTSFRSLPTFRLLLAVFLFAFLFLAQTTPSVQPAWYLILLDHLLGIVCAIVIAILPFITKKLFAVLHTKWKIDISQATQDQIDGLAFSAVNFAEEQGRKAIKNGKKVSSEDKYANAVKYFTDMMKLSGLETRGEAWIEQQIIGALGTTRATAVPALPTTI